ncbi:MAG TPA: RlmE family RNA methyltransferase [Denitromonas sp.]|nr:RlmE family RNA methyltransferase [Denitromonas sp.]
MAKTPSGKTSGRGQRDLRVRVKTAKGRKLSSTLWLERQLNDPYVQRARKEGYRGRAAYKILELDDRYRFLVPGARVVDLGCAPGGWCQIAVQRVNALGEKPGKAVGRVLGVDLQEVEPIAGAEIHQLDFLADDADLKVKDWLGGKADVVMSDMAAAASGHKGTDHLRIVALCEAAAEFAFDVLEEGGTFVAKGLAGLATAVLWATVTPPQRPAPTLGALPEALQQQVSETEYRLVTRHHLVVDALRSGQMTTQEGLRVIETELMPGWAALADALDAAPASAWQAPVFARYARTRREALQALLMGMETGDPRWLDLSNALQTAADTQISQALRVAPPTHD